MNLDDRSSNIGGLGIHSNKSTEQLKTFVSNTIKSPNAASHRTEEAQQRQTIPISRASPSKQDHQKQADDQVIKAKNINE